MSKVIVPALSKITIQKVALHIRKALGIEDRLYVPILTIVECIIPLIDNTFNFKVVETYTMPGEYAKYYPSVNELVVRSDVYEEACADKPRHRFTIAHELGHYFLHKDETSFARCPITETVPAYRDPEWQANVFASAFLASPDLICSMSAEEISERCKISQQAAKISLQNSKRG